MQSSRAAIACKLFLFTVCGVNCSCMLRYIARQTVRPTFQRRFATETTPAAKEAPKETPKEAVKDAAKPAEPVKEKEVPKEEKAQEKERPKIKDVRYGEVKRALLQSTRMTKLFNLTSNIASVLFFAIGGKMFWLLGFCMAAGAMLGGQGSRRGGMASRLGCRSVAGL